MGHCFYYKCRAGERRANAPFVVPGFGLCLMPSSPERPLEDVVGRVGHGPDEPPQQAPHLRHRQGDEARRRSRYAAMLLGWMVPLLASRVPSAAARVTVR